MHWRLLCVAFQTPLLLMTWGEHRFLFYEQMTDERGEMLNDGVRTQRHKVMVQIHQDEM